MTPPLCEDDTDVDVVTSTSTSISTQGRCISAGAVLVTVSEVSSVGIGAILGVLTRFGVNLLFGPEHANITSSQSVLFNDLPANVLGSFVIGVYSSLQAEWRIPKMMSLCISTGYAGSLTTFASWHVQIIQMLVEGRVLQSILAIFVGVCMAVTSLIIGKDVGNLVVFARAAFSRTLETKSRADSTAVASPEETEEGSEEVNCMKSNSCEWITAGFRVALFVLTFAGVTAGTIVSRNRNDSVRLIWTSAMFAPFGALLRWQLSSLNTLRPQFPVGTYVANMSAMVFDLALLIAIEIHESLSSEASFFLTALIGGLGGSLSTVSTWLSEALKLSPAWRYCYILCTIASAVLLGILSYGIAVWVNSHQQLFVET